MKESLIVCSNSHGVALKGPLLRLTRNEVVFEVYDDSVVLQMSEVLERLEIILDDKVVYSGRGVVKGLVGVATGMTCEATLEDSWLDVDLLRLAIDPQLLSVGADSLVQGWQNVYKIRPGYKLVVSDIHGFLSELNGWTQQIEVGIRLTPEKERFAIEREVVQKLAPEFERFLYELFERFETEARCAESDRTSVYSAFVKRQLHPLLLVSPFLHRIYHKPLGYPGDYEMVNMILRDPVEGKTLYAKIINRWILGHVPAVGHRNRIHFLVQTLIEEALASRSEGRTLRVLNLGCGPAREVSDFIAQSELANDVDFTLLDFNDETLAHAGAILNETAKRCCRRSSIRMVKKSVAQVLKSGAKNNKPSYDFIYCAGLFDYLPDHVCRQLISIFYSELTDGGLLLLTNVDSANPLRFLMDLILDWHLIYRTADEFLALVPDGISSDDVKVRVEASGSNLFLEIRKPR